MAGLLGLGSDDEMVSQQRATIDYANELSRQQAKQDFYSSLGQTLPGRMITSAYNAVRSPGDVFYGKLDPRSDEGISRAADLAGMIMTGGLGGGAPAGAIGSGPIRGYHGSPYSFQQFDPSKIGTGEGKQVFGRGFNFSENEKVAQKYRDQLSSGTYRTGSGDVFDPSTLGHMNVRNAGYKSIDDAIERAFMLLQTQPENKDLITRDLNRLIGAKEAGAVPNKGSMYEVNINAKPEQFLDWNKPVAEQKGFLDLINPDPNVQRAVLEKVLGGQKGSGEDYYKALGGDRNAQNVAQSLSKSGVPGIKYLGQASEEAGDASRNYVVFDSKIIDLLKKYGIVGAAGGAVGSGILADDNQQVKGGIL